MLALSLLVLGLLTEVAPASCQQGSTGQGYLGCREERAGTTGLQGGEGWLETVTGVGWGGGLRYLVLEGEYALDHSPQT